MGAHLRNCLPIGRMPKSGKPADLSVMQPTRFEFIFNLKSHGRSTSRPPGLLAIADEY
jgi:hypothetical protein